MTLPTAEEVAQHVLTLADPALTETGKLFEARAGRFLEFRKPV